MIPPPQTNRSGGVGLFDEQGQRSEPWDVPVAAMSCKSSGI